jgi:hypothetical protein
VTPVFVLGCERSGSTWVANILDAHPDVELWMEPAADYAGLLPELADRNTWCGAPSPGEVDALRAGLAGLARAKYPLAYRPGRWPGLRAADAAAARAVRAACRHARRPAPAWLARYELLNLHASRIPVRLQTRKRRAPSRVVVKELRLQLKARLVAAAFPEARALVTLRHPVTQVASMARLLAGGGLGELARALRRFPAAVASQPRLRAWAELVHAAERAAAPAPQLALYWLVAYQTLLEDLEACGLPHRVVSHEALARDPETGADELLAWCDLPASAEVLRYVRWSSASEAAQPAAVDTSRDSRSVAERAHAAVAPELRAQVTLTLERAAKTAPLHPALAARLE